MFTVVIAEKNHIDAIREYDIFLKPLIEKSDVHFCEWRPEEDTLTFAVPKLREVVGNREEWRAIVVCDERGLREKNPFDRSKPVLPKYPELKIPDALRQNAQPEKIQPETVQPETAQGDTQASTVSGTQEGAAVEEKDRETGKVDSKTRAKLLDEAEEKYKADVEQYYEDLKRVKFEAFEKSSKEPLTRLATFLCHEEVMHGRNTDANEDLAFREYVAESIRKEELWQEILNSDADRDIVPPTEMICIAKRTLEEEKYDIETSWTTHVENQYSDFVDWNLYFGRMRYLVFDILPKSHMKYVQEYLKFLYTLLILAQNDPPSGALRANRVYSISCEDNREAMDRLLTVYDTKLAVTQDLLESKLRELEGTPREGISNHDMDVAFRTRVPVSFPEMGNVNTEALYSKPKELGMATDCPKDEFSVWAATFRASKKALSELLRQERKSLRLATEETKLLNTPDYDRARFLDDAQLEEVEQYTNQQEKEMVAVETRDFADMSEYLKKMEERDKIIRKAIDTRMTRTTTIVVGIAAILIYLLGFVPLLFNNLSTDKTKITTFVLFTAVTVIMLVIAIVRLIVSRNQMRKLFAEFNECMRGIYDDINLTEDRFCEYLSHACTAMKGFSVVEYRKQYDAPETLKMRVFRKHIEDIKRSREELRAVFGSVFSDTCVVDGDKIRPYEYNFERPVDFVYTIPFEEDKVTRLEYMQTGNYIQIPIDFLKKIEVRREELYE